MIAENVTHDDELEGVKLLNVGALAGCLSISIRQVHRWNRAGLLPAPLKIGGCTRWRENEISRWLQAGSPARSEWEKRQGTELAPSTEDMTIA